MNESQLPKNLGCVRSGWCVALSVPHGCVGVVFRSIWEGRGGVHALTSCSPLPNLPPKLHDVMRCGEGSECHLLKRVIPFTRTSEAQPPNANVTDFLTAPHALPNVLVVGLCVQLHCCRAHRANLVIHPSWRAMEEQQPGELKESFRIFVLPPWILIRARNCSSTVAQTASTRSGMVTMWVSSRKSKMRCSHNWELAASGAQC